MATRNRASIAATQEVKARRHTAPEPTPAPAPTPTPTPDDDEPELEQDEVEKVTAVLPKALRLTLDDGTTIDYPKGTHRMPADHAEHWFSVAMGVTIVDED